jgi:hypothetical protein
MPRMGKRALHSGDPREYKDVYLRECLIDLPADDRLIPNARVKARIDVKVNASPSAGVAKTAP